MLRTGHVTWIVAALLGGCGGAEETDPTIVGLADATEIDVASKVPGRISGVHVHEGEAVNRGQKLVSMSSEDIDAKFEQVQATIDGAKARLRMAQNGARVEQREAARRQLDAARHSLEVAKKHYERLVALRQEDAVPQARLEEAELKHNLARDQVAMAQAGYELVVKGTRSEEIDALRAMVRRGAGTLAEVQSYKNETTQLSPISGEVSKVVLHAGELAGTGAPIITLVDLSDVWASFAVREDRLQRVRVGDVIEADVPALGARVQLRVFNISALGDFATWRATADKGAFDLKSFEVKARPLRTIAGLRPGMTIRWRPTTTGAKGAR
jgi:HlyD family secretion protein